jgi:hypothetical protein
VAVRGAGAAPDAGDVPELAKAGFIEGQNLVIDARARVGSQIPELARALVASNLDARRVLRLRRLPPPQTPPARQLSHKLRSRAWCGLRLPLQPIINPVTSSGNRFISRPLKLSGRRVSASGIRNHEGPLTAAGTRKNDKLNTLVFHANETLPR